MKPHIYIKHSYASSGYQQWACLSYEITKESLNYVRGLGATPAAAYADWKRMVGK